MALRHCRIRRLLTLTAVTLSTAVAMSEPSREAPRLVVVLVIDGLGQEQITKYRDQLGNGGFRRLLDRGAWWPNAYYEQATTLTAPGHATVLSGAHPYRHGLVGNDWFDRTTGRQVYGVEDRRYSLVGQEGTAQGNVSPANLLVPTVGDELRISNNLQSRVLSISLKDRGAILPGGRMGTAYFYVSSTGRFESSSYYMKKYPEWWDRYYASRPQDRWFESTWTPLHDSEAYRRSAPTGRPYHFETRGFGKSFPHRLSGGETTPGKDYYYLLKRSPFGHEYTLEFVKQAVTGEQIGRNPHGVPDLLAVSFSSHDYANHFFGPESMESQDDVLRLDRTLAEFFDFLDRHVGPGKALIALTADHGFPNPPEYLAEQGFETGRVDPTAMMQALNDHLARSFGPGRYTLAWTYPNLYLDHDLIQSRNLVLEELEKSSADFLRSYPGIAYVFSGSQIRDGRLPDNELAALVSSTWHPVRSGDLFVVQRPGWFLLSDPNAHAATHSSPYNYDRNVPLMLMGPQVRPGKYAHPVDVVDLAPTLAYLLGIRPPAASQGRVLAEAVW